MLRFPICAVFFADGWDKNTNWTTDADLDFCFVQGDDCWVVDPVFLPWDGFQSWKSQSKGEHVEAGYVWGMRLIQGGPKNQLSVGVQLHL